MTTDPNVSKEDRGALPPRWIMKLATRVHVFLHRISSGKMFNQIAGDDVVFVTMKGAKSGRTITIPLMHVAYGDGYLLVASQGGAPKNPVWYHNIVKNPDLSINYRGSVKKLQARLAAPEEKDAMWPICDQHYAPYADYRNRTSREIPIFVCEPGR